MAPKAVKRKSNVSEKYGPSEKRDFHVYDKVFAKMRGYPPWPAKITNIKIDSKTKSLKSKCEVYFYGSNQVGQCVFSDIHDYEANKDRFKDVCAQMKSLKTAFLLGLEEIENDNGPLLEEIEDGSVAKISFDDSFVSGEEESSPAMKKSKKTIEKDTMEESPLDKSVEDDDREITDKEKTDKEEEEKEKKKIKKRSRRSKLR
uniref:Hepatoma-derived growth factor-related protein 2 n=1 Tax=Cacopsylla melanoneura TaxID=428564 RepID=A0A8D8YWW0_9HEMI